MPLAKTIARTVEDPSTGIAYPVLDTPTYQQSTPYQFDQVVTQSPSFYDTNDQSQAPSILPLQVVTSSPNLPTLQQASGMISADQSILTRLETNFDPNLFDLSETSHLSRFLKALLGDSGIGQLRKRSLVNRLSSIIQSTHFYDLDGFYGALLSAGRRPDEMLPFDPTDPASATASADEWDQIQASDSRYRERIIAMARALALGGTAQGLRSLAEALTGYPCDVSETWRLLSQGYQSSVDNNWSQVMSAYPTWGDTDGTTWAEVSNHHQVGQEGTETPDEVVITVMHDYTGESPTQQQQDAADILRVLGKVKPAGVLLSVAMGSNVDTIPAPIASMSADSEFWQVTQTIVSDPTLPSAVGGGPVYGSVSGAAGTGLAMPVPAFSGSQQYEWYANSAITQITAFAFDKDLSLETGQQAWHDFFAPVERLGFPKDFETIDYRTNTRSYHKPYALVFSPDMGVVDPQVLASAQAADNSRVVAAPYSVARVNAGGTNA